MKKLLVAALAAAVSIAFVMPASALENEFGGYWRARGYIQENFNGTENGLDDKTVADTRTRLYYTAKFSDDFKFVNKFEFNSTFGDYDGGDVGADGDTFVVKNSYVDFTLGATNTKVGIQPLLMSRGLMFDDDFSGITFTYNVDNISIPFIWVKKDESDASFNPSWGSTLATALDEGTGGDDVTKIISKKENDFDYYIITPVFDLGDLSLNPSLTYAKEESTDTNVYYAGFDMDMKLDAGSVWFTGIYQFGEINDDDLGAYLVAVGGDMDMGELGLHGQVFYASGDKADRQAGDDIDGFIGLAGQSYYWSEIMGYGIFDNQASNGACADKISNVMAVNAGVSLAPMENFTITADLWYAMLAEDDANGEDKLGTELDLVGTYQIFDNLSLDLVAAYLFADDATGDEDPYELGTRLSLSF